MLGGVLFVSHGGDSCSLWPGVRQNRLRRAGKDKGDSMVEMGSSDPAGAVDLIA